MQCNTLGLSPCSELHSFAVNLHSKTTTASNFFLAAFRLERTRRKTLAQPSLHILQGIFAVGPNDPLSSYFGQAALAFRPYRLSPKPTYFPVSNKVSRAIALEENREHPPESVHGIPKARKKEVRSDGFYLYMSTVRSTPVTF